jgi:hypothetical protein
VTFSISSGLSTNFQEDLTYPCLCCEDEQTVEEFRLAAFGLRQRN